MIGPRKMEATAVGVVMGVLLAAAFALLSPPPARASEVTEVVRDTVERVLAVVEDPALRGPERKAERRARAMEIIHERFDFEAFSRRALGVYWKERTAGEREEFVRVFTRCLMDVYMDAIESRRIERVVYTGEFLRGGRAEVRTLVLTALAEDMRMDYRLMDYGKGRGWIIYDVVVDGVSLVVNYRTQFKEIIERSSYEELVEVLREKSGELEIR